MIYLLVLSLLSCLFLEYLLIMFIAHFTFDITGHGFILYRKQQFENTIYNSSKQTIYSSLALKLINKLKPSVISMLNYMYILA